MGRRESIDDLNTFIIKDFYPVSFKTEKFNIQKVGDYSCRNNLHDEIESLGNHKETS